MSTKPETKTTEMKIGRNKYIVNTYFKPDGRETAEQKLLRLVTDRISEDIKRGVLTA